MTILKTMTSIVAVFDFALDRPAAGHAFVDHKIRGGKLSVRAGGGIVYDSDPEMEYEETRAKSGAVAKAIEAASKIELDTDSI